MANPLESMGRRLEDDPFFLACALRLFAVSEGCADDCALAAALGCSEETLVALRLCRCPQGEPAAFGADVERIASRFGVSFERLAEAVRRGQSIWEMRQASAAAHGTLLAARDAEREPEGGQP